MTSARNSSASSEPAGGGHPITRRSMMVGGALALAGAVVAVSAGPAVATAPTASPIVPERLAETPPSSYIVELPPPADVTPGVPRFSAHVLR